MRAQPVAVFFQQQGEVQQFGGEFGRQVFFRRAGAQLGGRELMLLQFREQGAKFLGKTGTTGAGTK